MGLLHGSKGSLLCLAMIVMVLFSLTKGDINKDKEMCGNQLLGLSSCLPYVGGEAKFPTKDCCSGLKQVLIKSRMCLCIMIKDYNPSLGFKFNDTLAIRLPDSCHMPGNVSECPSLLHLPPGSPDAKIFEDYANSTKSKNNTIALPGDEYAANADAQSSDWGTRKAWFGLDTVGLLFVIVMLPFLC